jgi:restriction system protein
MAAFTHAWRRYESNHRAYELNHERAVKTFEDAHRRAVAAQAAHDARQGALNEALAKAQAETEEQLAANATAMACDAKRLEQLFDDAAEQRPGGVEALAVALWRAVPLPADFSRRCDAHFEPESGVLLLTIEAPDFERTPLSTPLKSLARKPVGERARRLAQQNVNHVLPLRIAHEIFTSPEMHAVQLVGVNVRLAYIDRRTGQPRHEVVASMTATREEFQSLNIAEVDAKKCFKSLRGVETPSYDEIASVKPLLKFDNDDRRIVEARSVVDTLDVSTNLAAMDWEDFEHIVRELFAKMFSARSAGAEVHVTRASRDYGVDALVYDPDPIMGGKYVIQAKRYVNTVEVSAVRDLFGTVQNEGASKGFLVTTSTFGPDAHQFAKGKPLTLIDGSQLLGLLDQHGYRFRIDLPEARRILHNR